MRFAELVDVYQELEATQSTLEKTTILADMFWEVSDEELERLVMLCMGRISPAWMDLDLGFSSKLMVKVVTKTAGVGEQAVRDAWRETGDLGSAAEQLLSEGRQSLRSVLGAEKEELSVAEVHESLKELASYEGEGSESRRINTVAELVSAASAEEIKYLVRLALRNLRLGVGEGLVRDAIAEAFFASVDTPGEFAAIDKLSNERLVIEDVVAEDIDDATMDELEANNDVDIRAGEGLQPLLRSEADRMIVSEEVAGRLSDEAAAVVQHGYDVTNEWPEVAVTARNEGVEGLERLEIELFRPVNAMLAQKVESIEDGFDTVGRPAAVDYKYDGMRAQVHKDGDEVVVFTRRLEDVTEQFPDVVDAVREHCSAERCIIDAEVVAYDPADGSLIPFQRLSKRIKRKYDIDAMVEEIPVEVRPFDLIYDGGSLLQVPYGERWERLAAMMDEEEQVLRLVDRIETEDAAAVNAMQQESLQEGHEGIMMKNLDAVYKPGSRVGYMVKLKPVMETLDLVIAGAKWSEGRRSGWLGRLKLACWDEERQKYRKIGKMATGLTDEQLEEITERLEPLIEEQDGRDVVVTPEVIVEVEYEEIQESPTYDSGYALRFPRLKSFRDDKEEADSLEKVERLYEQQ